MTQRTIYTCDGCQKEIGAKPHLSLTFGTYSGVAVPPSESNSSWRVVNSLQGQFRHFCTGSCAGRYFTEILKKNQPKKK